MIKLRKRAAAAAAAAVIAAGCAGQASAAGTKLPILMYHNLTTDPSQTNSMTVTDTRFRRDMEFLEQYGFTALLPADLVNIRSGARAMPQRPVMITFDDGYESNYTLAYPVLRETGVKATISLITSHMRDGFGNGLPTSLTWDQIREMYDSGYVDFGSHTNALHNEANEGIATLHGPNGIQRQPGESYSAYMQRVNADLAASVRTIQTYLGADKQVYYFSYPFGATDSWFGQALLDNHFYVSTITVPKTADIADGLYGLPRFRVEMKKTVSQLLQHTVSAQPSVVNVALDGRQAPLPTYQIEGSNFVKLRDIAALLRGTQRSFSVEWSGNDILLRSGVPYTMVGGELVTLPAGGKTGQSMVGQVNVDGKDMTLAAYNIAGNYYFKLRSLAEPLGFTVSYDEANKMIQIKTT